MKTLLIAILSLVAASMAEAQLSITPTGLRSPVAGDVTFTNNVTANALISGTVMSQNGLFIANNAAGFTAASTLGFGWAPSTNAQIAPDTVWTRTAAGTSKLTDGSTGTGTVIVKLPTSCSGLATGTLYNNAGTPAICP